MIRLVLHGGTPKTGTSALQHAMVRHAESLRTSGVWYPSSDLHPVQNKHQYLVNFLLSGDAAGFNDRFDQLERAAPARVHTIVLSSEGLFNHWPDYPQASKGLLRGLTSRFDLQLWVCFRPPVEFAVSLYAQVLRNPRRDGAPYGLDIDFEAALEQEWFARRLDYAGFIRDAQAQLGAHRLRTFRYGRDIVQRLFQALGAPPPPHECTSPSLGAAGVALMRIVNRYSLPHAEQLQAARLVLELERAIGYEPFIAGAAARRRIEELNAGGWQLVEALTAGEPPESR